MKSEATSKDVSLITGNTMQLAALAASLRLTFKIVVHLKVPHRNLGRGYTLRLRPLRVVEGVGN